MKSFNDFMQESIRDQHDNLIFIDSTSDPIKFEPVRIAGGWAFKLKVPSRYDARRLAHVGYECALKAKKFLEDNGGRGMSALITVDGPDDKGVVRAIKASLRKMFRMTAYEKKKDGKSYLIIKEDLDLHESSSYRGWREPTVDEIKFEYMVEYPKLKPAFGNIFPTEEDFIKAVQNAPIVEVDDKMDRKIEYRSGTTSIESLKSLVATYRYPRDVDRIVKGLKSGASIPTPIVVQKGSRVRVMGGNTRMDVAFILGINPKVKLVKV